MDAYSLVPRYLSNLLLAQSWAEMQETLQRAAEKRPRGWLLPVLACEAVGGEAGQAAGAVVATACSQVSILLIDDMLDADPRGEHQRLGMPQAANLAAAFQSAALAALVTDDSSCAPAAKQDAFRSFNEMMLTVAFGQQLDALNPSDETAYWRVVNTKSVPFFSTALSAGALAGGASIQTVEQIRRFGCLYGEMIQVHDDLHDSMAVPANSDWTLGRSPLPILFAQVVDHPDRVRFLELRQNITNPQALAEAQTVLVRCGAISYGIHQLLLRYEEARALLKRMSLPRRMKLDALLEELIEPVQELFREIGATSPKSISAAIFENRA